MNRVIRGTVGLMLLIGLSAGAAGAHSTLQASNEQKAIDAFTRLQAAGTDPVLAQAASLLRADGYTRAVGTRAAPLRGQCAAVGCSEDYLVTTLFQTEGPNPRSAALAAIVSASSREASGRVRRVLTEREIDDLVYY
jgi:hypothetical protein